ncbi:MAG: tRNA (adenosine(37)-N6)-threonylcarbamoyltransferase complex ATPase subunit type 1 TsaE [Bacteroidales bacterium]
MQIDYTDIANLKDVAKTLINIAREKKIWLFYGTMGVGKTTLISHISKELGSIIEVSSPTFAIVNEYPTNNNTTIYHFDFYRINKIEEIVDIGFEDYLNQNNCYCFIEWPELAEPILRSYDLFILRLQQNENGNRWINTDV